MADNFGEYLDAQMRLLFAGYAVTYHYTGVGYAVTALKYGERTRRADGPTLTHTTIRLADRLAPGAK